MRVDWIALIAILTILLVCTAGANVYYPIGNFSISNFYNASFFNTIQNTAEFYNATNVTSNSNYTFFYGGGDESGFLFLNGSRSMTGDLNLSSNNLIKVGFIDKVSQSVDPGTPPAQSLRLYAKYDPITGFTVYKYKDDTGMVRELVRDSVIQVEAGEDNIPLMAAVRDCGSDAIQMACLADAGSISTMPAIGLAVEPITATGSYGRVMMVGLLENVDTSAWNEGDILYVSATVPGGLTNIKPSIPGLSQEMGVVLVKSATDGNIQVLTKSVTGNEYGTINDFSILGNFRVAFPRTPASSTAICNRGEINWDANYVYVCIATNTWKRAGLSTW